MRVVIQRVSSASVTIDGAVRSAIGPGLLILLGVGHDDGDEDIDYLVRKTTGLRIFDDADGVMNRSILETGGEALVVSQFTLMASTRMSDALGREVGTGTFGADMQVALVNDGPVTICMDSKNK